MEGLDGGKEGFLSLYFGGVGISLVFMLGSVILVVDRCK